MSERGQTHTGDTQSTDHCAVVGVISARRVTHSSETIRRRFSR
ncbi:hypothetical protein ACIQUY_39670 [Streptomyces sp. NPDC090231]